MPRPEYIDHKKQTWWGSAEQRNYRRTYIQYAAEKAGYNFVYAMIATALVYSVQPKPAPIEIRLLSPGTATQQLDTRFVSPPKHDPSFTTDPSTVYEHNASKRITVWKSGLQKEVISYRPR